MACTVAHIERPAAIARWRVSGRSSSSPTRARKSVSDGSTPSDDDGSEDPPVDGAADVAGRASPAAAVLAGRGPARPAPDPASSVRSEHPATATIAATAITPTACAARTARVAVERGCPLRMVLLTTGAS
jgi:hypothetical protein